MSGHTPGPWRWEFNATHKYVQLCGGRPEFDKTVMDFTRWGMGGATPRFTGCDDGFRILHKLSDRKDWIAPITDREHHAHWCATVDHPDARLIAAAPDLLDQHEADMVDLDLLAKAIHAGDPMPELVIRVTDMLNRKRAAIAKATGAQP
jgi:hypothetical protein